MCIRDRDKLDLQQQRLDAEVKFRQDKRKFEQYEKLFEERLIDVYKRQTPPIPNRAAPDRTPAVS